MRGPVKKENGKGDNWIPDQARDDDEVFLLVTPHSMRGPAKKENGGDDNWIPDQTRDDETEGK